MHIQAAGMDLEAVGNFCYLGTDISRTTEAVKRMSGSALEKRRRLKERLEGLEKQ